MPLVACSGPTGQPLAAVYWQVHVGCDSCIQPGGTIIFATVVCAIRAGHAGRYYYCRLTEQSARCFGLQLMIENFGKACHTSMIPHAT